MKPEKNKNELRSYRLGPLTILQWMAIIAVLGLFLAWIFH